ncbi:MAG TPA: hypothetical protein VKD89_03395 [Candidatus Udaeobacter sp.]|nr:hypothetical protein [Candidatus Udaeobacter sp.]
MNLWREIFGVAETALGGWIANAARLATIGLAILFTIYKGRLWKLMCQKSTGAQRTVATAHGLELPEVHTVYRPCPSDLFA